MVDDAYVPARLVGPVARTLVDAGCRIVQLRMKTADDRTRLEAQRAAAAALAGTGAALCVNDRADLARILAREAPPGVVPVLHLGQDDLPPTDARAIVGESVLLGLSTHTPAQLAAAGTAPVDYLGYGPVFPTTSKLDPDAAVGIAGLAAAVAASPRPVVAIGGITADRLPAVVRAGPAAVAIIGALYRGLDLAAPDALAALAHRVRSLQHALP